MGSRRRDGDVLCGGRVLRGDDVDFGGGARAGWEGVGSVGGLQNNTPHEPSPYTNYVDHVKSLFNQKSF